MNKYQKKYEEETGRIAKYEVSGTYSTNGYVEYLESLLSDKESSDGYDMMKESEIRRRKMGEQGTYG